MRGGYDYHVKANHNIWNYLFYLYYLKKKDKTEFTGVDTYIMNMIDKDDHFWMPMERALSISKQDSQTMEQSRDEQVFEVCDKVKLLMKKAKEVLKKKEKRMT